MNIDIQVQRLNKQYDGKRLYFNKDNEIVFYELKYYTHYDINGTPIKIGTYE